MQAIAFIETIQAPPASLLMFRKMLEFIKVILAMV
jgi:hypothetical protein